MTSKVVLQGIEYDMPKKIELDEKNFIRIRVSMGGRTERVWAYATPEDREAYKADVKDSQVTRVAVLANDSIFGIPSGCIIPYAMVGEEVPVTMLDRADGFPMHEEYGDINIQQLENSVGRVDSRMIQQFCYMYFAYGWLKQKQEWEDRVNKILAAISVIQ